MSHTHCARAGRHGNEGILSAVVTRSLSAVVVLGSLVAALPAAAQTPQPVVVVNPAARPAATYDVDAQGRRPYRCSRYLLVPAGVGSVNIDCDAVAANHRLVVEHVSAKLVTSSGNYAWMSIGVGPETAPVNSIFLIPTRVIQSFEDWLMASQPVTFYAEPGEIVSFRSNRGSTAAEAVYEVTIQGRLMPMR